MAKRIPRARPKGLLEGVFKRVAGVRFRKDGARAVTILRPGATDYYYCLIGVSALAWQALDGKKSLAKIAGALPGRGQVAPATIEKDILGLRDDLLKAKLIVEVRS